MKKNYDFSSSNINIYKEYNNLLEQQNLAQAQDYIKNNNLYEFALGSWCFEDILNIILYSNQSLEDFQFQQILSYIGIPPTLWIPGNNYKVGDKVYQFSDLDTEIYFCIKNINNSSNLNNQNYWLKTSNYYTKDSLIYIYQSWIDKLQNYDYPKWSEFQVYYKNNVVYEDKTTYICITSNLQGTQAVLSDTTQWLPLDIQGIRGINSVGIKYKSSWISGYEYSKNDMVSYTLDNETALYIASQNIEDVNTPPSVSTEWKLGLSKLVNKLISYPMNTSFEDSIGFWYDDSVIVMGWHIKGKIFLYNTEKWNNGNIDWIDSNLIINYPLINYNIDSSLINNNINIDATNINIDAINHKLSFVLFIESPSNIVEGVTYCDWPSPFIGGNLIVKFNEKYFDCSNYQTELLFPLINIQYLLEFDLSNDNQSIMELNNYKFVEIPQYHYIKCAPQSNISSNTVYSDWKISGTPTSNTTYLNTLLNNFYKYFSL